jgi:hypothetical protein
MLCDGLCADPLRETRMPRRQNAADSPGQAWVAVMPMLSEHWAMLLAHTSLGLWGTLPVGGVEGGLWAGQVKVGTVTSLLRAAQSSRRSLSGSLHAGGGDGTNIRRARRLGAGITPSVLY